MRSVWVAPRSHYLMKPKKAIKELEKQLRKDPDNLVLRLKLAAVYREVGRRDDAVALYRSVAVAYHSQGRLVQAIAVCKSVLEIEPSQRETQALLTELDRMRALQAVETDHAAAAAEDALETIARDRARVRPVVEHHERPAAPAPAPPGYAPAPAPPRYSPRIEEEEDDGPPPAVPSTPPPRPVNPLGVHSPTEAVTKPLPRVDAPPEFGARSGMTPLNKAPEVPPIEEVTPGSQVRRLRERALSRHPRTTQRGQAVAVPGPGVPGPGVRRSSPSMSHTPLPEPLALHEADPSVVESMPLQDSFHAAARSLRQTHQGPLPPTPAAARRPPPPPWSPQTSPDDDEDAMTRIADERISEHEILAEVADGPPHGMPRASSEDAPTTIASEMAGDDDGPTIIAPPNLGAMRGAEVLPEIDDPDEDALTTIADDKSGALPNRRLRDGPEEKPRRAPAPARAGGLAPANREGAARRPAPSVFVRDTRRLEEEEVERLVRREPEDEFDDLPTPPPLGPLVAPAEKPATAAASSPSRSAGPAAPVGRKTLEVPERPIAPASAKPSPSALAKIKPKQPQLRIPDIPMQRDRKAKRVAPPSSDALEEPRTTRKMRQPQEEPRPTKRYPRLTRERDTDVSAAPLRAQTRPTANDLPPSQDPRPTVKLPFPGELSPYQRGDRLLDLDGDAFSDEAVTLDRALDEVERTAESSDSGQAVTNVTRRPARPASDTSDDALELHRAFDKPFSDTIDKLGPDGAVIDMPLSIFSVLPDDALAEMARRMTLRRFDKSEIVLREGEPGDACFVIAHGEVRVLKRDPLNPRGDLIEVARLGPGSLFGEFALLADRRRHATVQAVDACDIYEIPRRLLRELAATFPEVGPLLEKFYRERLLATLLSTAPFFKPLAEERRGELLARFKPRRAESGERIVVEGKEAGGLYLIVLGSVEITKRVSDKRSVLLATLGEGAYFGEMSLLKGGVACASVRAVGPTELAVLAPKDFYEVVSENPRLWDEVRREANRRQLEMSQIVTGETNLT